MSLEEDMLRMLNKVAKWRTFFASWQLGTRPHDAGELRAVKNQRELFILLRVEQSALARLLLQKGVFTLEEWQAAVLAEAAVLDAAYEEAYPGWSASADDGLGMNMKMPEAGRTMHRLGFPP